MTAARSERTAPTAKACRSSLGFDPLIYVSIKEMERYGATIDQAIMECPQVKPDQSTGRARAQLENLSFTDLAH